jgi:hypothetical protein
MNVVQDGRRQILPRHGSNRPFRIVPYFLPETGQGLQREQPRITSIRYKRLQDPKTYFPVIFALVIQPTGDCRGVRKILSFREKASDFQVQILAFFDASKELQDYPERPRREREIR